MYLTTEETVLSKFVHFVRYIMLAHLHFGLLIVCWTELTYDF